MWQRLLPDALSYTDEGVPAGRHAYRLDVALVKSDPPGQVLASRSCEAEVAGGPPGIRCAVFGGIAVPPVVLIDWDPLPKDLAVARIDVLRDGELAASLPPDATSYQEEPLHGEHVYRVVGILAAGGEIVVGECAAVFDPPRIGGFVRGDSNSDGEEDLSDAVFVLLYLFQGGAAPSCKQGADSNDDGALDLSDAVYLLGGLFLGGPPPPPPFPDCGDDPTPDELECEAFAPCFNPPPPP